MSRKTRIIRIHISLFWNRIYWKYSYLYLLRDLKRFFKWHVRWHCLIHNSTIKTLILSMISGRYCPFLKMYACTLLCSRIAQLSLLKKNHFCKNQFSKLLTLIYNSYLIRQSFYWNCYDSVSLSLHGGSLEITLAVNLIIYTDKN